MKKITALLMSCIMITSTLASCGKNDSEDKSETKKVNPAIGTWVIDDEDDGLYLNIKSEKNACFFQDEDFTDQFMLDSDGNLSFNGEELSKDYYDFDGKELVLHMNTDNDLTMTKIDDSNDNAYGEYRWTGGTAYDAIVNGYNSMTTDEEEKMDEEDIRFLMICEENSTTFRMELGVELELDDKNISIDASEFFGDEYVFSGSYTVKDDKLTISNDDDDDVVLERAK